MATKARSCSLMKRPDGSKGTSESKERSGEVRFVAVGCYRNDGSAWPRSLRSAQRNLGSVIGMMAGPGRSPDVPDPGHRLLRLSFPRSFHQALLHPTRPHSTECLPNLSCLDSTGAVSAEDGQLSPKQLLSRRDAVNDARRGWSG